VNPERWRIVNQIFNEALAKEPQERGAFLERACANDSSLKKEVEVLIASQEKAGTFLRGRPAEFVGSTVGPYQIQAQIGSGGMGEVYRAHDSRVGRDVAIKVAAQRFSERFEREARAIAALNHPNTCHLYDVGPNFLVMELVEGPTLADRLKQGAIPLDEALKIAAQIADALEAAHQKGITHRDLKPANIKIKADGTVKVLDFGLAKRGGMPVMRSDNSPTVTIEQTDDGVILGTSAYMSPEQAKGKPVDQRADIYAFGVVLYEMVTGKRLHQGDTITETLASVIKEEPQWEKVPPQIQRLLRRCLEKDPQKRLRHIGDVMSLVDEAPQTERIEPQSIARASKNGSRWLAIAAIVTALVATGVFIYSRQQSQTGLQVTRLQIPIPEKISFTPITTPVLSPNGHWVTFVAPGADGTNRLWIRALDSLEIKPLEGTDNSGGAPPFWSPDSKFIGFVGGGKLKKVEVSGGPPQIICDVQGGIQGGAWNPDGVIIFGGGQRPLLRVSDAGGPTSAVTMLGQGDTNHRWPQFLPDGRHFLYHRLSSNSQNTGVFIGSLDAKPDAQNSKPMLLTTTQARFVTSDIGGPGWLLFLREGSLLAQRFNPDKLEISGDPMPVAAGIGTVSIANYAMFSTSAVGSLVYRSGGLDADTRLVWVDEQGRPMGGIGDPAAYAYPTISPNGKRIAVRVTSPQGNADIWVLDVTRGTSTRLTFDPGRDDVPIWSSDGTRIFFSSNRSGHFDLYQKSADGLGDDQLVLKSDDDKYVTDVSRDGRYLLYTVGVLPRADVWVLRLEDRKTFPFLTSEFTEGLSKFSPDGRWVTYMSTETGNSEIYVRPFAPSSDGTFAATGGKWMVSKGGGGFPYWRRDGKQLFYSSANGMTSIDVVTDKKTFEYGIPKRLFSIPIPSNAATGGGAVS
jgi:eukaryotic-like serine/threonine-protein kinase